MGENEGRFVYSQMIRTLGYSSSQGDSTHKINQKPSFRKGKESEKGNIGNIDVRHDDNGGFVDNSFPSRNSIPLKLPPRPPRQQLSKKKPGKVTSSVQGVQGPTASSSSDVQMKRDSSNTVALIPSPRKRSKRIRSNPCNINISESHRLIMSSFNASRMTRTVAKHDAVNSKNVNEVYQYATDIYQRLYDTEGRHKISPWTKRQAWISSELRYKTVDWICRIHWRFRLHPGTLYLGIQLFDRFCSKVAIYDQDIFLVSSTALLIASKYEEVEAPKIDEFCFESENKFSCKDMVKMETKLLERLEFRISVPTARDFLPRFLFICNASCLTSYTASYYLERCLPVEEALKIRPSTLAAAAVCLALGHPFLEQTYNPELMVRTSGRFKRLGPIEILTALFSHWWNRSDETIGGVHYSVSKRPQGGFAINRCRIWNWPCRVFLWWGTSNHCRTKIQSRSLWICRKNGQAAHEPSFVPLWQMKPQRFDWHEVQTRAYSLLYQDPLINKYTPSIALAFASLSQRNHGFAHY